MTKVLESSRALRSGGAGCIALACGLIMLAQLGCKSDQLTSHGTRVVVLASEPIACENLGDVLGQGGHLGGGYIKKSVLIETANNRARNAAAEMGATHILLKEPVFDHGTAVASEHDMQPSLAHGDSAAAYVRVEGVAFKCRPGEVPQVVAAVLPDVENPPAAISLLPLGALKEIVVYQRNPASPGREASETELRRVDDQKTIQEVATSLMELALDPIKYIPTHRVEFVGELGTQSLLYGFGYLEYAGRTYRLTTGTFETLLGFVDPPPPEVESETPAEVEREPAPEPPADADPS